MIKLSNLLPILKEDPDSIVVRGKTYKFTDDESVAVIIMGDMVINYNSKKFADGLSWVSANPKTGEVWLNGTKADFKINPDLKSHWAIRNVICKEIEDSGGEIYLKGGHSRLRGNRARDARLFKVEMFYRLSFWDTQSDVRPYKNVIIDFMDKLGQGPVPGEKAIDYTLCQFKGMSQSNFLPFDKAFESTIEKEISDEESELIKKLHLLPPDKKAEFLKKLGAMNPNKLQVAADKLGMTTIQLKQLLGKDIAENKD